MRTLATVFVIGLLASTAAAFEVFSEDFTDGVDDSGFVFNEVTYTDPNITLTSDTLEVSTINDPNSTPALTFSPAAAENFRQTIIAAGGSIGSLITSAYLDTPDISIAPDQVLVLNAEFGGELARGSGEWYKMNFNIHNADDPAAADTYSANSTWSTLGSQERQWKMNDGAFGNQQSDEGNNLFYPSPSNSEELALTRDVTAVWRTPDPNTLIHDATGQNNDVIYTGDPNEALTQVNSISLTFFRQLGSGNITADYGDGSIPEPNAKLYVKQIQLGVYNKADVDQSGLVGVGDVIRISQNWGDTDAMWQQGDITGDHAVQVSDVIELSNYWNVAFAAPPDAAASGSYDPDTGVVTISLENVSVWQLTASEPFNTGVADLSFFGDFTTDAANEIGALNLAGKWTVSDYEIGAILPAGLGADETLTLTYGTIQGTSSIEIVIPEPATMALLSLGGLAAILRRRRVRA